MGCTNEQLKKMHQLAMQAMRNAYGEYSGFSVGACLVTTDNQFFSGCNVENIVYGLTQCAEANAVGSMINVGCRKIKEILVVSSGDVPCPPCGICRQLLCEFAESSMLVHIADQDKVIKSVTLNELLPSAFGAGHMRVVAQKTKQS